MIREVEGEARKQPEGGTARFPFPSGQPQATGQGAWPGAVASPAHRIKPAPGSPGTIQKTVYLSIDPPSTRVWTVHPACPPRPPPVSPLLSWSSHQLRRLLFLLRDGFPGAPAHEDPHPRQHGHVQGGRHHRLHQDGQCPALGILQDPGYRPPLPDGTGWLQAGWQVLSSMGRAMPCETLGALGEALRLPTASASSGEGVPVTGSPRADPRALSCPPLPPLSEPGSLGRGDVT